MTYRCLLAGIEGGIVEDLFTMDRRGCVQYATNAAVGRTYVTGWYADPPMLVRQRVQISCVGGSIPSPRPSQSGLVCVPLPRWRALHVLVLRRCQGGGKWHSRGRPLTAIGSPALPPRLDSDPRGELPP